MIDPRLNQILNLKEIYYKLDDVMEQEGSEGLENYAYTEKYGKYIEEWEYDGEARYKLNELYDNLEYEFGFVLREEILDNLESGIERIFDNSMKYNCEISKSHSTLSIYIKVFEIINDEGDDSLQREFSISDHPKMGDDRDFDLNDYSCDEIIAFFESEYGN